MLALGVYLQSSRVAASPDEPIRKALQDTGLTTSVTDEIPGRPIVFDSHGGFHGDGCTVIVFQTSPGALWEEIQHAKQGWTVEEIDLATYGARLPACSCHPPVYPAPDVVFDAWYFRDDYDGDLTADGRPYATNCSVAFYDAQTGLFYFYRTDT